MDFSQEHAQDRYSIRATGQSCITVQLLSGTDSRIVAPFDCTHSLLLYKDKLIHPWRPQQLMDLESKDLAPLLDWHPLELVILGTGPDLCWPDSPLLAPLQQRGIGVEVMNNAAACRTYNVVNGDLRHAALALLLPPA